MNAYKHLIVALLASSSLWAEQLTILHVGDQETWLLSAQGNLRDNATQPLSFYGGVDRLAAVMDNLEAQAILANRSVLRLNAGDVILPGPRFNASLQNLTTSASDGGQDYYDAIAMRALQFDATVFGNHEFDFGLATAARFAEVAATASTPYLSFNLDFSKNTELATLAGTGKVAPYALFVTPGGKNVAVIGVTTPLLPSVSSPETLGLMNGFRGFSPTQSETTNLEALAPHLQALINDLRSSQGVDVVIIMSHLQNFLRERDTLVPLLQGVDLVISGGGHELQTSATSTTIPTTAPVFGPALPNPAIPYPSFATDAAGKSVPVVTAHFGNRYVGEITLEINDATGVVSGIVPGSNRVVRVSGYPSDADFVSGNATLFSSIVEPVKAYIDDLNTIQLGTTQVVLNGERGSVGGVRSFTPGVRNSQTNLGDLVADSLRFATGADVSIQNGGGVRASIAGPNITIGDTFNTLTFLNLVVMDPSVNAAQLKAILEHGFAASTTTGSAQGRFPQISGLQVIFDTTRPAGDRVRRVVLTRDPDTSSDDIVLVDSGRVADRRTTFSVATIDFLANGGDGYPFIANGFKFSNPIVSRNYQEALADFITTPADEGGLEGLVLADEYPVANPFNRTTRSFDMILGTPSRDVITGTSGNDYIEGGHGPDEIDGGTGADVFVYRTMADATDTIYNFELGVDKIHVGELLENLGLPRDESQARRTLRISPSPRGKFTISVRTSRGFRPLVIISGPGLTRTSMASTPIFIF